jgi:hypothetical protein
LDVPYLVSLLTFNNFVTLTYWSIPCQTMNQVSLNTAPPKKLALLPASRNSSVNHSLPTIGDLLTKTSVAAPTTLPEVLIGTESPLAQTITATNNKPTSAMAVAAITGQVTAGSDSTIDYEYWPCFSAVFETRFAQTFNPRSPIAVLYCIRSP